LSGNEKKDLYVTIMALGAMVSGALFGGFCIMKGVDSGLAFAIAAGIFGVAGYEIKSWRDKRSG